MNMISKLRQEIKKHGSAILTSGDFDELQAEWIKRTKAEYMVSNLTIATNALQGIESTPFDCEGHFSSKEAANHMQLAATKALSDYT